MYDQIRAYTRKKKASKETKVQVITTRNVPIQGILRDFYTSAVVNFLTWNKAYSLFPLPTFIQYRTVLFKGLDPYYANMIRKYRRRGWTVVPKLYNEDYTDSCPFDEERRVGDPFTWMIPFNNTNVTPSKTPDTALEYCAFSVLDEPDFDDAVPPDHFGIRASLFVSKVLKYQYTCSSSGMARMYAERLHPLTQMELLLLETKDRPVDFDELLGNYQELYLENVEFERPVSWQYYDHLMPEWHAAYMRAQEENDSDDD